MEDSNRGGRRMANVAQTKGETATAGIEERLTIRVPGPISEVLVDEQMKAAASGITGLILDHEGGWAVGGYLAKLLKQNRAM